MTLLDDFLAKNGDAIAQLSVADQLKLSHHLIEAVANALFGVQAQRDDEGYECVDDEDE